MIYVLFELIECIQYIILHDYAMKFYKVYKIDKIIFINSYFTKMMFALTVRVTVILDSNFNQRVLRISYVFCSY